MIQIIFAILLSFCVGDSEAKNKEVSVDSVIADLDRVNSDITEKVRKLILEKPKKEKKLLSRLKKLTKTINDMKKKLQKTASEEKE
ncbi:MAG: hypothetical protein LBL99_01150 [Holosporaceae bacterium]|jgi:septal ring factor EnvC (AmiA/AmiB activator)|nr:hypothetical protein [Holosporaceae bacterium]